MSLIASQAVDRLGRAARRLDPRARDTVRDLSTQMAEMRRDVGLLADIARRNGARSLADAGDTAQVLARILRRGGSVALREAERRAGRHPVPTIALVGLLAALIGYLFLRRE